MTTMEKRRVAVKTADAINAIEGVPVSSFAEQLSRQWMLGHLTGEQMKIALLTAHHKLAELDRSLYA